MIRYDKCAVTVAKFTHLYISPTTTTTTVDVHNVLFFFCSAIYYTCTHFANEALVYNNATASCRQHNPQAEFSIYVCINIRLFFIQILVVFFCSFFLLCFLTRNIYSYGAVMVAAGVV